MYHVLILYHINILYSFICISLYIITILFYSCLYCHLYIQNMFKTVQFQHYFNI